MIAATRPLWLELLIGIPGGLGAFGIGALVGFHYRGRRDRVQSGGRQSGGM